MKQRSCTWRKKYGVGAIMLNKSAIVCAICLLLILCCTSCLFLPYEREPESDWFITVSSDGKNSARVTQDGQPFSFGAHALIVYANDVELLRAKIKNDGKALGVFNYSFEWIGNETVVLTLKGEEQYDETITITFDANGAEYKAEQVKAGDTELNRQS